ncbi:MULTISPECIES: hypothetical protein [Massilia]|uniref:Uncharacterized protein n=1 Tax=Massilia haematophila TaxID=457923 RepID=A0ABV7PGR8_9BURK|nr:hypothetical protein [Massilia sp.]HBZ07266.1 hypothetical protein [Massilia sp.]
MEHDAAWIDNSNGDLLQYDFFAPSHWTTERVGAEQAAIADLIDSVELQDLAPAPRWLQLARRLPGPLRAALLAELRAGNQLAGIGSAGWPGEGSIVVNMRDRFSAARHAPPFGVTWRAPEDAHYAREELRQRVGAVEFLILT